MQVSFKLLPSLENLMDSHSLGGIRQAASTWSRGTDGSETAPPCRLASYT